MSKDTAISTDLVDDLDFKNCRYGTTVRSAVSRGKIRNIQLPSIPDGYIIAGSKEIPGDNRIILFGSSSPYLASSLVRYRGEPILLVAGPDTSASIELAKSVKIEYEELPPAFSPAATRSKSRKIYRKGNPSGVFRNARRTLTGEYVMGYPTIPTGQRLNAAATWNRRGILTLYSTSSYPFHTRDCIARLLNLPKSRIRIIVPPGERSVGERLYSAALIGGHAALLSYLLREPVKILYNWEENSLFAPTRYPTTVRYKTAYDENGGTAAMDVGISIDAGAYHVLSPLAAERAALAVCGVYSCDNIRVQTEVCLTNHPPRCGTAGLGEPQAFFAAEIHSSKTADAVGLDPYIWKKTNLPSEGSLLPLAGKVKKENRVGIALDTVTDRSDFRRKYAAYTASKRRRGNLFDSITPLRGIGLAVTCHGLGLSAPLEKAVSTKIRLRMDTGKKLRVLTSLSTPTREILYSRIVEEILEMSPADIIFENVDTSLVPDSGPDLCSRGTSIIGGMIEQASRRIKRRRTRSTSPFEVIQTYKPESEWDGEDVVAGRGSAGNVGDTPYLGKSWAASAVEVEIDPITLAPECKGIWIVLDAGRIYDEVAAANAVESSVMRELMLAQTAEPEAASLHSAALAIPPIDIHFLTNDDPGAIPGLGDSAASAVAPAFISAVMQATGLVFSSLPLTPAILQREVDKQNLPDNDIPIDHTSAGRTSAEAP